MRSVIMTISGDPFPASLSLRMLRQHWYDEIDQIYLCYNNWCRVSEKVSSEFLQHQSIDPKVHIIYHPNGIGPGLPIQEALLLTKADNLLLLEEDCVIFKPGVVDGYFKELENDQYDILGSPRGSASEELYNAEVEAFGMIPSALPDQGPNLWPNMLFTRKHCLLQTDMDFGSKAWYPGQFENRLDHTFKERADGDTWVWATIQLRFLDYRIKSIPQHHYCPDELEDKDTNNHNYEPSTQPFSYIHFGSLSSGWNGYLSEGYDGKQLPSLKEMENRLSAWLLCAQNTEGYEDFRSHYIGRIIDAINNVGVDKNRLEKKSQLLKELVGL